MRLPEGLRGPPEPPGKWWLAGTVVLVVVIFVTIAMPWHEVGKRVYDSELPRPRLHGPRWGGLTCINTGDYFTISVDRHGGTGIDAAKTDEPPESVEAWMRERVRRQGGHSAILVRAHRHAPWSSIESILESASRTGHEGVYLQIGDWHFLLLVLVPLQPAGEEIRITALPLSDPEGTLAASRERSKAGGRLPVLHLALAGNPHVETVLHALECFAADEHEGAVRLVVAP